MNDASVRFVLVLAFGLQLAVTTALAREEAQVETSIDLDPAIECWFHDAFPRLDAFFDPPGDVAHSRLYFRCTQYPDYYFVDLSLEADHYRAVAPKAEEDCPEVAYYVELVRTDFTSWRTQERTAPVTDHSACRRRYPGILLFAGDPDLIVGSTGPTVTGLAGFQMDGVTSFITATGEIVSVGGGGGGLSTAAAAGIAAGAGGGAIVAAAASGGEDGGDAPADDGAGPPAPPPPPPTTTTTAPPAPPPGAEPVEACIETDPVDATILAGESIELDARCSTGDGLQFSWDLGDGRTREGPFINPVYRTPGEFTVTLTVTQEGSALRSIARSALADPIVDTATRTVTVEPQPVFRACFQSQVLNPGFRCDMLFDGSCSEGNIVRYQWILDETNVMGFGPVSAQGVQVTHDWSGAPGCQFSPPWPNIRVVLTITDPQGNTERAVGLVEVQYLTSPFLREQSLDAGFSSYLGVAPFDGNTSGQIRHNGGQVDLVTNAAPAQHRIRGRYGENLIEAYTTTPIQGPGYWRFDFRDTGAFVPRSIEVKSGQVLAIEPRAAVFRLSGEPGERIRFTYKLLP